MRMTRVDTTPLRNGDSHNDDVDSFDYTQNGAAAAATARIRNRRLWVLVGVLLVVAVVLLSTTIAFARSSTSSSSSATWTPSTSPYIGEWQPLPPDESWKRLTVFSLSDTYELLPNRIGRGGIARVAYIKDLLQKENPSLITVLAGDLVSPSAFQSVVINGVPWNGYQMIAAMNALGINTAVLGNHEFDPGVNNMIINMEKSHFHWISYNTFWKNGTRYPNPSLNQGYMRYNINNIRILVVGLTIDTNQPSALYINNSEQSIAMMQTFIQSQTGTYDLLLALTHLDQVTDELLVERIPQINLLHGGHEHANVYLLRGDNDVPITKADASTVTVWVHRVAIGERTGTVRIQSNIIKIDDTIPEDSDVAALCNSLYASGVSYLQSIGINSTTEVCTLPLNVTLDGRSVSVRKSRDNLLNQIVCKSLLFNGHATMGVQNAGSIRIDDVIPGGSVVTELDVLRILPFTNLVVVIRMNGTRLLNAFFQADNREGNGQFLVPCGDLQYDSTQFTINGAPIDPTEMYQIATNDYMAGLDQFKVDQGDRLYTGGLQSIELIKTLRQTYAP